MVLLLYERVRFISGCCVSTKVIAARREKLEKPGIVQSVYPKQLYGLCVSLLNCSWNKGNQLNDSCILDIRGAILD